MPDRGSVTVLKGLRVRISARKSEAGFSYYPGIPAVFIEHYIDEQQARKERAKNYHGNQFSKAAARFSADSLTHPLANAVKPDLSFVLYCKIYEPAFFF